MLSGIPDGPNPYTDPVGWIEVPFVEPVPAALKRGKVDFKADLVNKRPENVRST